MDCVLLIIKVINSKQLQKIELLALYFICMCLLNETILNFSLAFQLDPVINQAVIPRPNNIRGNL